MQHIARATILGITLGVLWPAASAAGPAPDPALPAPATAPRSNPLGAPALDAQALSARRGGTQVFNDMQLRGVVADNQAVNVRTGTNAITNGAFSNTSGLPMVIQNTGNNVLIQNATIVNIELK